MHLLRLQLRPEALAGDADAQVCHCLEGRSPPSCVRIALRMGVGAPSVPVVAVGDKVRKNQLVADIAEKKLGVKMHASISGVVTDITADYIEIRKAAK